MKMLIQARRNGYDNNQLTRQTTETKMTEANHRNIFLLAFFLQNLHLITTLMAQERINKMAAF